AQPWQDFAGQTAGLAAILENIVGAQWPGTIVAAGAVISIFSVTLVSIYGQTRILFTMSRDGMMPKLFGEVNPRTLTPVKGTIVVTVVIAILAGFIPLNFLAEMTSIGTLVAFVVVSLAVIILRVREPNLERGFKVPFYPVLPVLAIIGCLWIISNLQIITIVVFLIWTAVILGLYFIFGRKSSVLGKQRAEQERIGGTDPAGGKQ
ncbi:MAG: amino acid permease, partial [Brevibacterium aurantiacum]|nr:amino acid permease [Brevibacterium aurantiacum]